MLLRCDFVCICIGMVTVVDGRWKVGAELARDAGDAQLRSIAVMRLWAVGTLAGSLAPDRDAAILIGPVILVWLWLLILILIWLLIWLLILIVRDFRRPTGAAREWWREAGRRASELGHGGP
jgi:hypothetical protein